MEADPLIRPIGRNVNDQLESDGGNTYGMIVETGALASSHPLHNSCMYNEVERFEVRWAM